MEQPPLEYTNPTISDVLVGRVTRGTRIVSFTMKTAGERLLVILWNPQLVRPDEWEPLSAEQLQTCFADCDMCSVFNWDTNRARMEFQKTDALTRWSKRLGFNSNAWRPRRPKALNLQSCPDAACNPPTPSLRARRPERHQQVDQVQHVDGARAV